ncbi:hypothetical protein DASC09_043030 [Saccharomycopsis crataegensis]|uniref:Uncharacterized protein n=1 Tax=Saccharomycopsis crataegensis TaxID=43959 RepID=A0AAV5QPY4_9ASCO|nr:hypothetical protein DASC09_043030 [Saccharomycopsis crataegensis]
MFDCMKHRDTANYDRFDDAILVKLKIYAPSLMYPDTQNVKGLHTSLSGLERAPLLEESLKIDDSCRGFDIIEKLENLVWLSTIYGVNINSWSDLLFLYLSPVLKQRIRVRLTAKGSLNRIDRWLHSLFALTENIHFRAHQKEIIKQVESFCPNKGDCLIESLLKVIRLSERLPDGMALENAKRNVLGLTMCYFLRSGKSNKDFLGSLGDVESSHELRQLIWGTIPEEATYY